MGVEYIVLGLSLDARQRLNRCLDVSRDTLCGSRFCQALPEDISWRFFTLLARVKDATFARCLLQLRTDVHRAVLNFVFMKKEGASTYLTWQVSHPAKLDYRVAACQALTTHLRNIHGTALPFSLQPSRRVRQVIIVVLCTPHSGIKSSSNTPALTSTWGNSYPNGVFESQQRYYCPEGKRQRVFGVFSPPQAPIPFDLRLTPTRRSTFRNDIVTVYIGDGADCRQYKVHSKPLCDASPFFDRAMHGGFAESKTREIHLHDEDPWAFDILLWRLYDGVLPPQMLTIDPDFGSTGYHLGIMLYDRLIDKLLLPDSFKIEAID